MSETTQDWRTLPAWQELNEVVDRVVFGRAHPTHAERVAEAERVWASQPECLFFMGGFSAARDEDGTVRTRLRVPAYSTDLAACVPLIARLHALRYRVTIRTAWNEEASVTLDHGPTGRQVRRWAPTTEMALCRAAVAAVGGAA